MTRYPLFLAVALAATLSATAAAPGCYADYKAKRDDPLRLHYGTIRLAETPCTRAAAEAQIPARIATDGWQLLNVLNVFGEDGLAERKESAGKFHLRY